MLIACPSCQRQFKTDRYPPGQRVRCLCGHGLTVPEPRVHEARILHCADCGAPLPGPDAGSCEYCGGVVDPNQEHYTLVCPGCFARMPEGAKFCIECALPIRPQQLGDRAETRLDCPRCKTPLRSRVLQVIQFDECPSCLGLWLSSDAFKAVAKMKVAEFQENPLPDEGRKAGGPEPVQYIPCPECGDLMNRQNYARRSGVIVDRCRAHGIWLDDRELERIAAFIADGGLARSRADEAEEQSRRAIESRVQAARSGSVLTRPVDGSGAAVVTAGFFEVLGSFFWD